MVDVIRFYKSGRKVLVHDGITEEQAREWCNNPLTQKEGKYFDGFAQHGAYKTGKPIYTHYHAPTEEYH